MHQKACALAKLGICANQQGKFREAYEAFFEQQEDLATTPDPITMLKGTNINLDTIKSCMAASTTTDILARQIEQGIALNVESTPTFFVNGIKVAGGLPTPVWKALLTHLLGGK